MKNVTINMSSLEDILVEKKRLEKTKKVALEDLNDLITTIEKTVIDSSTTVSEMRECLETIASNVRIIQVRINSTLL